MLALSVLVLPSAFLLVFAFHFRIGVQLSPTGLLPNCHSHGICCHYRYTKGQEMLFFSSYRASCVKQWGPGCVKLDLSLAKAPQGVLVAILEPIPLALCCTRRSQHEGYRCWL